MTQTKTTKTTANSKMTDFSVLENFRPIRLHATSHVRTHGVGGTLARALLHALPLSPACTTRAPAMPHGNTAPCAPRRSPPYIPVLPHRPLQLAQRTCSVGTATRAAVGWLASDGYPRGTTGYYDSTLGVLRGCTIRLVMGEITPHRYPPWMVHHGH
jgi:hypothetical protein